MILVIVLIVIIMGLGIIGVLYSSLLPFIDQLGSAVQYNTAYYGAVMGVERALVAVKMHEAGFEGESGLYTGYTASDALAGGSHFGFFTSAPGISNSYWTVKSRVSSIPMTNRGDVEPLFADLTSANYNALGYHEGVEISLYLDNDLTPSHYYTPYDPTELDNIASQVNLSGTFRLPPKILAGFGGVALDTNGDIDTDTIGDDVILNWGIQGHDTLDNVDFIILPTIFHLFGTERKPNYPFDNTIRESTINAGNTSYNINTNAGNGVSIPYGNQNPDTEYQGELVTKNNILPISSHFSGEMLRDVLGTAEKPSFFFALTNLLTNSNGDIYPFLERQLQATDNLGNPIGPIADRYFTIQGVGVMGNYKVVLQVKKPTKQSTNTSNFTIIF